MQKLSVVIVVRELARACWKFFCYILHLPIPFLPFCSAPPPCDRHVKQLLPFCLGRFSVDKIAVVGHCEKENNETHTAVPILLKSSFIAAFSFSIALLVTLCGLIDCCFADLLVKMSWISGLRYSRSFLVFPSSVRSKSSWCQKATLIISEMKKSVISAPSTFYKLVWDPRKRIL